MSTSIRAQVWLSDKIAWEAKLIRILAGQGRRKPEILRGLLSLGLVKVTELQGGKGASAQNVDVDSIFGAMSSVTGAMSTPEAGAAAGTSAPSRERSRGPKISVGKLMGEPAARSRE